MNFLELQTRVFRALDESQAAPRFWTAQDIKDAINEGYEEISDATDWYEVNEDLTPTANTTYHDLDTLLVTFPLTVTGVFNTQTNRWLTPSSAEELDGEIDRWEVIVGPPERFWLKGLFKIGFFPKPPTAAPLTLYFSSMPVPLNLDADVPGFPVEFHLALLEYAKYDLLSQDGETKEALLCWGRYLAYEAGLAAWVKQRTLDRVGVFRG